MIKSNFGQILASIICNAEHLEVIEIKSTGVMLNYPGSDVMIKYSDIVRELIEAIISFRNAKLRVVVFDVFCMIKYHFHY